MEYWSYIHQMDEKTQLQWDDHVALCQLDV